MAKKATAKKSGSRVKARDSAAKRPVAASSKRSGAGSSAADAVVALLQSPLVADLVAVAATAALAALAQEGFGPGGASSRGERAGRAVKRAGKAAADAVGRRLSDELAEIKKAAKAAKGGATK